jgi:hypothetical protein
MFQRIAYPTSGTRDGQEPVPDGSPFTILRTETVLSRLPIHTLTKHGTVDIAIVSTNDQGVTTLRWEVSASTKYGAPRQLAYKLDTLVVNRRVEACGRPLPTLLKLGSLNDLAKVLGSHKTEVKRALQQNATAAITAYLPYTGTDGNAYWLDAVFTRYSVVFTGQRLPTGQPADAVYLVLNALYREVLDHAPVRPLDYDYLTRLTPTAQRCYELLSYKLFAALKHRHPQATMPYGEYCTFAPQQRYVAYDMVKKQMYKVHKPHLESGYLARVHFEAMVDAAGVPDLRMVYTPGPKARAEFLAFTRQQGAGARAGAAPAVAPATEARPQAPDAPATTLVQYFYQRFHGVAAAVPPARALGRRRR